jgi:hypothetical protein
MAHNLTDVATYTTPVSVPDDGDDITATRANAGDGPVNPAFQALANRTAYEKGITDALQAGTLSVKSLTVDGTGGQTVSPPTGALTITTNSSGAYGDGELWKNTILFAKCKLPSALGTVGGFHNGANVDTLVRTGTGIYQVTTLGCPAAYTGLADNTEVDAICHVQIINSASYGSLGFASVTVTKVTVSGTARLQALVSTFSWEGQIPADYGFCFTLYP